MSDYSEKMLSNINDALQRSIGKHRGIHVKDTAAHTGRWWCFQVQEDAVIAAIEADGAAIPEMVGVTYVAGFEYYACNITSITLTSGHIKLFNETAEPNV